MASLLMYISPILSGGKQSRSPQRSRSQNCKLKGERTCTVFWPYPKPGPQTHGLPALRNGGGDHQKPVWTRSKQYAR